MMKKVRLVTLLAALSALAVLVWPSSPQRDLKLAGMAYRARDLDQALRLARRAAALGGDDLELRLEALGIQARAALALKRPDMAQAYLDRMLALDPNQPLPYLMRGSLKLRQGDQAGALADLDRGLALASAGGKDRASFLAPYYARRGRANLALGRVQPARRDIERALAANPRDPEAHQLMSKIEERAKRWRPALVEAEKALRLALARDRFFFMKPQGKKWLKRLVWLRMKNKVDLVRPYRGN